MAMLNISVATALYAKLVGDGENDLEGMHPHSVGGGYLLTFAECIAAEDA
jgi:hypothetical protein